MEGRKLFPENAFRFFKGPDDSFGDGNIPAQISLTLTRQDEFLLKQEPVVAITIRTQEGEMGIMAGHEYAIEQLAPGVLELEYEGDKKEKYAISGGFAHINDNGVVDINTVEAVSLEEFDDKKLAAAMDEARAQAASSDEMTRVQGEIALEIYEPLDAALKSTN
jgi:F-type H+-transporting ATPase subunit delta